MHTRTTSIKFSPQKGTNGDLDWTRTVCGSLSLVRTKSFCAFLWLHSLCHLNAGCFTVAVVEGPGLIEASYRTRYRAVILMHPLVIVNHFVHQPRFFFPLMFRQAVEITRIALENRKRRCFKVIDRAT